MITNITAGHSTNTCTCIVYMYMYMYMYTYMYMYMYSTHVHVHISPNISLCQCSFNALNVHGHHYANGRYSTMQCSAVQGWQSIVRLVRQKGGAIEGGDGRIHLPLQPGGMGGML